MTENMKEKKTNINDLYNAETSVGKDYQKIYQSMSRQKIVNPIATQKTLLEDIAFIDIFIHKLNRTKEALRNGSNFFRDDVAFAQEFIKINTTIEKLEKQKNQAFQKYNELSLKKDNASNKED